MVRKIFIYTADEVKKLSPKINLPISEEVKIDNLGPEMVVGTGEQKSAARVSC